MGTEHIKVHYIKYILVFVNKTRVTCSCDANHKLTATPVTLNLLKQK